MRQSIKKYSFIILFCLLISSFYNIVKANFEDLDSLYYQVSADGEIWWYCENNQWLIAENSTNFSTLNEIKENIDSFATNENEILFKGFKKESKNQETIILKNKKPEISITEDPKQILNNTGQVSFGINIKDNNQDNTAIKVEYANADFSKWNNASISLVVHNKGDTAIDDKDSDFQIGKGVTLPTSLGDLDLIIIWDAKNDLTDFEGDIKIRLTAYDGLNYSNKILSQSFDLDTAPPKGLESLLVKEIGSDYIKLSWDKLIESKIKKFKLYFGKDKNSVTKAVSNSADLQNVSNNEFELTGLEANTSYFFKIEAEDLSSNKKSTPVISSITFPINISKINEEKTNSVADNTITETKTTETKDSNPKTNTETSQTVKNDTNPKKNTDSSNTKNSNNTTNATNIESNSAILTTIDNTTITKEIIFEDCTNKNFEDADENWAKTYIDKLRNICVDGSPILKGYANNLFKPDEPITRFEFLKLVLIANKIDFSEKENIEKLLYDIPYDDSELSLVIYKSIKLNIVSGYENGNFYPNKEINRAEAAKILFLADNQSIDENIATIFKDMDWYVPYVYEVMKIGFMKGYDDGTFGAENYLLRSESAKIVYNIIESNL